MLKHDKFNIFFLSNWYYLPSFLYLHSLFFFSFATSIYHAQNYGLWIILILCLDITIGFVF